MSDNRSYSHLAVQTPEEHLSQGHRASVLVPQCI